MKLYNTLTRNKDDFQPLNPPYVKLYVCGLTVYSHPHIGNWVAYVYSDILVRTLKANGFSVEHIQNITDVGHLVSDDDDGEDKMQKGARLENKTAWEVADKYIAVASHEAYDLLKLHKPRLVRATDLIEEQINFIKKLEAKNATYVIDDGVYFDTSVFTDYGKLAQLDVEGLQAGARVEMVGKKNITDFALWKFSPTNHKRDMEWDSPWGKGFPGWHIECSAIALNQLGEQIDIHIGGIDHIPVHHTNEIAQTETLTGKRFSKLWMHVNHLKVNGTKMSKSLQNIYTIQDVVDKGYSVDAYKLTILSKHYRTEGNFTWDILESSQNRLCRWKKLADLYWQNHQTSNEQFAFLLQKAESNLLEALNDDINTPEALVIIETIMTQIEQHGTDFACSDEFKHFCDTTQKLLGISLLSKDISDKQKLLINDRANARQQKDWKKADIIRETLLEQGIGLDDKDQHQYWFRTSY